MMTEKCHYFLTIAKYGNISKAAEELSISQPYLSNYLKNLENKLGHSLFNRKSMPLSLTPVGVLYKAYIEDLVQKNKELMSKLQMMSHENQEKITLGLTPWRSANFLPLYLPSFQKKYPYIKIELFEGNHHMIYRALDRCEIDFGIVNYRRNSEDYLFNAFGKERILLVIHKDASLLQTLKVDFNPKRKKLNTIDFKDFAQEPLIMLKQGQYLNAIVTEFLNARNYNYNIILRTENILSAINFVSCKMGITFVQESFLHNKNLDKNLAFFAIDNPPLAWDLGFIYLNSTCISQAAFLLMKHIQSHLIT